MCQPYQGSRKQTTAGIGALKYLSFRVLGLPGTTPKHPTTKLPKSKYTKKNPEGDRLAEQEWVGGPF